MRGTADSGTGDDQTQQAVLCDRRTIGIACVCDDVPVWIIAPVSA